MKKLKNFWNLLFCKEKKENNQQESKKDFATNQALSSLSPEEVTEKDTKSEIKKRNSWTGKVTKAKIMKHLENYGSIDTYTCHQEFKVKSLRNFISQFRKEGRIFKTEKITINTVSGQSVEAIKYTLLSKN
jgi:hypothetical protein